jgi:hypothetical protein
MMNTTQRGALVYARARELLCVDEPEQALPLLMEAIEKYDNPEAMFELAFTARHGGGWSIKSTWEIDTNRLIERAIILGNMHAHGILFEYNAVLVRLFRREAYEIALNSNCEFAVAIVTSDKFDINRRNWSDTISPFTTCRYAQYMRANYVYDEHRMRLYESAAEAGIASAMVAIALIRLEIDKHDERGLFWLKRAVRQNHNFACEFAAEHYCFQPGGNARFGAMLVVRAINAEFDGTHIRISNARRISKRVFEKDVVDVKEHYQYGKSVACEMLKPDVEIIGSKIYDTVIESVRASTISFLYSVKFNIPKDVGIIIGKMIYLSRETDPVRWV